MTKENIILAALRLFLKRGYGSVSVIDVANATGITKGGIYHYFSSKDDLLHVALHYLLDRIEDKYAEILNQHDNVRVLVSRLLVERSIEAYAYELLQVKPEDDFDYAHFAIEVMRKYPDIKARIEQSYLSICNALSKRLAAARDAGELHPGVDCFALAVTLLAIVNGQKSLGSSFQTQGLRQQVSDSLLRFMEGGACCLAGTHTVDEPAAGITNLGGHYEA